MPQVVSDIVDVYVFRRLNARVQFLLLQRRSDVAMPQTWQAFHSLIDDGESTIEAVRRAVDDLSGLNVSAVYSADYVNQFYDESRDVLVLAPVFAVNVSPQAPVELGDDFRDCAWFDRDEATSRLPFSGQRWATRHIDEIMSLGEVEAEIYRLELPSPSTPSPLSAPPDNDEPAPMIDASPGVSDTRSGVDSVRATVELPDSDGLERGEDDAGSAPDTDEPAASQEPEHASKASSET
jgi:dihydroneopterin triphosphate diphosphatase